jgi:DNA-binding transcriptional MerR regulator
VAEYRLDELARVSGVSARNIRAYRERGLLDPPRRVGRSALYDDYHLSQLNTISQLLRKGFNSVHIAEFFDSMRKGTDLADILGLQRAVLGAATDDGDPSVTAMALGSDSDEARRLVGAGLAAVVGGRVVLTDAAVAEILNRSADTPLFARALLRFVEAAEVSVDRLAEVFVTVLVELHQERFGPHRRPKPAELDDLGQLVADLRILSEKVMAARFHRATARFLDSSASGFAAGLLLDGAWEPRHSA